MYKLKFYSKSIFEHLFVPDGFYRNNLSTFLAKTSECELKQAFKRVHYYFKRNEKFEYKKIGSQSLGSLSCFNKSAYFYDLRSIIRYFPKNLQFDCWLRDVITVPDYPCFVKCRPIDERNENSAILKLNQIRHYRSVNDSTPFKKKVPKLAWRGSVFNRGWRAEFVKKFINNPLCDVGATIGTGGILPSQYEKNFMSINEQLQYRFIFSIEGADVATNLKWIAQSNSLCFMKKPKHESWFMENSLIPDYHYVSVDKSLDDVTSKIEYYLNNPTKAEKIISNMKKYFMQFEDHRNEFTISLLVAMKYFFLSGQISLEEFGIGNLTNNFLGDTSFN